MGSICGDLQLLTKRQLHSMIRELSREIDCLKSDLLRHKLLSNECQKYLHFLAQINDTNDTSIENHFIKQINDLKDTQNCFIALNELPLNVLSNHFDDMFVSIGRQTSYESLEVLTHREDNTRHETQDQRLSAEESDNDCEGIECETEWISMDVTNDGSVDENQSKNDEIFEDKTREIEEKNHTISDTNVDINCLTICAKETQNRDSNASNDLQNVTNNGSKSEDIMTDSLDTNCRPKRKKSQMKSIECEDNDSNTDEYNCGASDEDIRHELDIDLKPSVKKRQRFVCDIKDCHKLFTSNRLLLRHQSSHLDKRFFCESDNCCRHFGNYQHFMDHKAVADHEFDQSFTCGLNDCLFKTTSRVELEEHISHHSDEDKLSDKQFVCDFIGCDKRFFRRDQFLNHKQTHHRKRKDIMTDSLDTNCKPNQKKSQKKSIECKDNDSNTDEYSCGASDEDINDESDIDYKQRVKRVKTTKGKNVCDYKDCKKSYNHRNDLRRHKKNHLGKRYFCDYDKCCKHFSDFSGINRHKKSGAHVLNELFTCGLNGCDYQTIDKDVLEKHIANHKSDDHNRSNTRQTSQQISDKFVCDFIGCHKILCDKYSLTKHKSIHLGETYPCNADGCSATFAVQRYLNRHKVIQHCNKYQCDVEGCGYSTGAKNLLNQHMIRHSTDYKFKCLINDCDKSFKSKNTLIGHQIRVHPNDLPDIPWIQCTYNACKYKTKCNGDLTDHMNIHLKPYKCDECGKGYADNRGLNTHKTSHNESLKLQCEWYGCERRFSSRQQLKGHMNTHTAETTYRCQWPGCDKTYLSSQNLFLHEKRVHKGIKDLSCHWPECDYTTTNPIRLNNHINKQHEGLDAYHCSHPNCDFKTTKCGEMDRHMTTHSKA